MTNNLNTDTKGLLRVIGTYIATIMVAILIIVFATLLFIDTTRCGALSRALPVLLGTVAMVFLASFVVARVLVWRAIPGAAGRWAVLVMYGVVLLVSFVVIAFGLLLIFNC